ncbi:MAG: exo-alpha-sialidase [Verrucomicrobiales bacterium]
MRSIVALCLFLLSLCPAAAKPPNVLFIAVDDLRPELACYGTRAITPNIDALAGRGVRFDRAYCNQAVCGASRVSLMTGLYPERTGERSYHVTDWRKRHPDVVTMNQHFGDAGYQTVGLGKIYHGTGGAGVDIENWDEWIRVKASGYASEESLASLAASRRAGSKRPKGPSTEAPDVEDEFYPDGAHAKVAAEQIGELAAGEEPFFLAVGFTKPHLPFVAPQKYWDLYQRDSFELPANLGFPPGYPEYARNKGAGELRAYSDCPKEGTPADFPDAYNRLLLHGYHACVSYMDAQLGIVLEALEKSGAADNTIIVFWADHGWKLGEHTSWCKHTNFEVDARVPLIVRVPGVTDGAASSGSLVELIDLYPTLCDLAGIGKPAHLQGRSFARLLAEPEAPHRDSAYSSYPHGAGKEIGNVVGHSIRTGAYRYTEWWKVGSDEVVAASATNLESDPGELTNLLPGAPALSQILSMKLHARVAAARSDYKPELIYSLDDRPTPQCHASTIAETADGVVAAWFGGKREKATDVGIWFSRHRGGHWSRPVELVDGSEGEEKEFPCWNPVLHQVEGGPLMLFSKVGPTPSSWWGMLITSDDQGESWSEPRRLGEDAAIGNLLGPVKNKPLVLADGKTLICPSSSEHDGWRVHFELTPDLGKTWSVIGPINDGKEFAAIQPSILQHGDGRLQVLCRSQQGVVASAFSGDGGRTWGPLTATDLPNPNAGTDAVTLADGRHILVFNPTTRKSVGRGELAVAISDDGESWHRIATLEKERGEFSYPAVIQTSDGNIHITYTYQRRSIKHVVLSPPRRGRD